MQMSESITEVAKAMSAFQGEIDQPEKSADNPFFKSKYVPLNKVVGTFKKFGPKNGLSFMQYPVNGEHSIGVETLIMHSSGEWIKFDPYFLPIDKQTPQGAGSAITYAKRYALSAALGIDSDEDDDGNQASQSTNHSDRPHAAHSNVRNINAHTASPKQIGLIRGLWKGSGGKSLQLEPWAEKTFKKPLEKLTSHEASGLITKLQAKQKSSGSKPDEQKWQGKPAIEDPFAQGQPLDNPYPSNEELPF